MKKRIVALLLILCLLLCSCELDLGTILPTPPVGGEPDDGTVENPPDINDSPLNETPESSESASSIGKKLISLTVIKDTPTDLVPYLDENFPEIASWTSACNGVATVDGGVVLGVKYGRTEIIAEAESGERQIFSVTVEFLTSTNNGYTFPTVTDNETYAVTTEYEADRLIDLAIATHREKIVIDFSALGAGYDASRSYQGTLELSGYVSVTKKWYENKPNVITFELDYDEDTASSFTTPSDDNTYLSLANANMVIRRVKKEGARPDDFDAFPITLENKGKFDVYNSEELWWAIEQGYEPSFPLKNSKAELFYERAKMLLREIITDGMTELEKILAIYDALVDGVAYDYDAAATPESDGFHTDVCYYLEGVFERARAVCDGKSKAFVLLCGIEGISAVRDFGSSRYGGAGHAWNYVSLDGEWYLVDTTAADSAYSTETSFGEFFGKNVEATFYGKFLVRADALLNEYIYSGIWDGLNFGTDDSVCYLYLTEDVCAEEHDFYIDNENELEALIKTLTESELAEEYILTFVVNEAAMRWNPNLPHNAARDALPESAEYAIYTLDVLGLLTYVMLIKGV